MEERDKPATKGDLTDMQQAIAQMFIDSKKETREWIEESDRKHNERMDKMDQANKDFMTWMVGELNKKQDK